MSQESNSNGKARMNISISHENKGKIEDLAVKNIRSVSQQAEHLIALSFKYADLITKMELEAALPAKNL